MSPSPDLHFWSPDVETPAPSLRLSTLALTKAEVDLGLPVRRVPALILPDSRLSLIFPASPLHRGLMKHICPLLRPQSHHGYQPSHVSSEPPGPVCQLVLLFSRSLSTAVPFPCGSPIHFQTKVQRPAASEGPLSPSSLTSSLPLCRAPFLLSPSLLSLRVPHGHKGRAQASPTPAPPSAPACIEGAWARFAV